MKKQISEKYVFTAITILIIVGIVGIGSHSYYMTEWDALLSYMGKWVFPVIFPLFIVYSFLYFQKNSWSVSYLKWWADNDNRLAFFLILLLSLSFFANFVNGYFGDDTEILVSENVTNKHCGSGGRYGSSHNISFYSKIKQRPVKMEVSRRMCQKAKIGYPANIVVREGLLGILFYKT